MTPVERPLLAAIDLPNFNAQDPFGQTALTDAIFNSEWAAAAAAAAAGWQFGMSRVWVGGGQRGSCAAPGGASESHAEAAVCLPSPPVTSIPACPCPALLHPCREEGQQVCEQERI